MIVADLTARGIYDGFENWYQTYFGSRGIVVVDKRQTNQIPNSNQNEAQDSTRNLQAVMNQMIMYAGGATAVPPGLENIVNWIDQQIDNKFAQFDIIQYLSASGVNMTGGPALQTAEY